ncbi:MAG: hypothetical protein QNJ70_31050 [Xenococcaceae cyanobacterium MO_207.B15]|nr:hypothetical protein [Xenococcaceae cyanobacterium MO_207.B15]
MKYQHSFQKTQLNSRITNFQAVEINGNLFFTVDHGTNRQLWKTDGTPTGTVFVRYLPMTSGSRKFS